MVARCAHLLGCTPHPGGWPPGRRLLVLLALAASCAALGLPGVAHAEDPAPPPACPQRPADYDPASDPDPVIAELRRLRQEQVDVCATAHNDAQQLVDAADDPVKLDGVDADHPLAVHDGDQRSQLALDDESRGQLVGAFENVGEVLHTDLWFLVGLLCALPFAYFLARLVMARA